MPKEKKHVVVYSTSTCHWCVKVKEFLKENDIKFQDINVAEDEDAAMEMIEKSGQQAVPVIEVDGNIVVGFNEQKLRKLLNI